MHTGRWGCNKPGEFVDGKGLTINFSKNYQELTSNQKDNLTKLKNKKSQGNKSQTSKTTTDTNNQVRSIKNLTSKMSEVVGDEATSGEYDSKKDEQEETISVLVGAARNSMMKYRNFKSLTNISNKINSNIRINSSETQDNNRNLSDLTETEKIKGIHFGIDSYADTSREGK